MAAATLLEPHVGLPVCIAFAWLFPRSRLTLAFGVGALALAALLTFGIAENLEYLRAVVPAQVSSELRYQEQYSLAYFLQYVGVAGPAALFAGAFAYLAAVVLAVPVSHRLMLRYELPSAAVFAPAAFAVSGGSYVHITQICFALPLPLALALRQTLASRRASALLTLATALLAVPWPYPYDSKPLPRVRLGRHSDEPAQTSP